jgi:hypothetical protein
MITPVCTETPNRARNPTPEETLKLVCVISSASKPPNAREHHVDENQQRPFERSKHAVENEEDQQDRKRNDDQQSPFGALFTLVLTFPVNVIPARQLNLGAYILDRFLDGAT